MENIIKRAQIKIEIGYVKDRIEYHRRTIHHLQAMGIELTDQLNKLEKSNHRDTEAQR